MINQSILPKKWTIKKYLTLTFMSTGKQIEKHTHNMKFINLLRVIENFYSLLSFLMIQDIYIIFFRCTTTNKLAIVISIWSQIMHIKNYICMQQRARACLSIRKRCVYRKKTTKPTEY